jgi:hypothetical protein
MNARLHTHLTLAAAVVALSACASSGTVPAAAIARAEAGIDQAERVGAYEHGNREINAAREKLAAAKDARDDGDEQRAIRLADEARLDAELAAAMAENAETQAAAEALNDNLAVLRSELAAGS